ncbi:MAG: ion transporter [Xenococcaceae cyanobacterium]
MLLRERIALYFEDIETPTGLTINFTILGLIMLSLAMFVAETYPIPDYLQIWFHDIDLAILIIFAAEYLIRFWCADSKIKFLFSFFSLIDLIAIIPLLLGFMDIRFIRIFRWFRVLRIIRFMEFEIFIFRIGTEDGVIFARILLILFSIIFVYSGLIYQVEHIANPAAFNNLFDAIYFSIVTMTTVGFGDITPLSQGGRTLTLLMILTGIILIPWQLGDLIKQFLKTSNKVKKVCAGCGLSFHDADAEFCKICGVKLEELSTTSLKRDSFGIED